MALTYVDKQVPASPYRVDNRVIVSCPAKPVAASFLDGSTVIPISGVRVNADIYGSGS